MTTPSSELQGIGETAQRSLQALVGADLFRTKAFIGGRWVDAESGRRFNVCNPADQSLIADVPDMDDADVSRAIEAAETAFKRWRKAPADERARVLLDWHRLIVEHAENLAHLVTLEQGKPLAQSRSEVNYGADFVRWFAEEARRINGDVLPISARDRRLLVLKQPVGVTAGITPWNFPNAMVTRKVAPALAAGCAIILKTSEETPLSALALVRLAEMAGLPEGLFNVVTAASGAAVGAALTRSQTVRKLTFTGSTAVGKLLQRQCADTVKKVSLELGGNAPFIVFDDADLDVAVKGIMTAKYKNSGQACVCANRIYVHDSVYEPFLERLRPRVEALRLGSGFDPAVDLGPLINAKAVHKVTTYLAEARMAGANVITGGNVGSQGATFFEPTIVTNIPRGVRMLHEEIFGPVAPIVRFSDEETVLRQANATNYGLAAYCFTRDISRLWRVAEELDFGMIGVNETSISTVYAPFGGHKESGLGREGSVYGIDEFLETKYVCVGGLTT